MIRFITRANLIIALVVLVILFVLYGNKSMMNEWAAIVGVRWIWVPIIIIIFATILYSRYYFRKKP
jgi:hypothetical protein